MSDNKEEERSNDHQEGDVVKPSSPPPPPPQRELQQLPSEKDVQQARETMQLPSKKCAIEQEFVNALLPFIEKAQKRGAFTLRDAYLIVGSVEQTNASPNNSEQKYKAMANSLRLMLNAAYRAHSQKTFDTDEVIQLVQLFRNMDKRFKRLENDEDDAIIRDDIECLRKASTSMEDMIRKCCRDLDFQTILEAYESIDYLNETADTMT